MSEQQMSTRDLVNAYNNASGPDLNLTWSEPVVQEVLTAAVDALEDLRREVLIAKAEQENAANARNIQRNKELIESLRRNAK